MTAISDIERRKKKKRKKNRRRELIWGKEILLVCAVENEREGETVENEKRRMEKVLYKK